MKHLSFLALALLVLAGAGCAAAPVEDNVIEPIDEVVEVDTEDTDELEAPLSTYISQLKDVTGGEATGLATVMYWEGDYDLNVMFYNLPELEEGYFYEGWIVRRGDDMSVLSTGATTIENSVHLNIFSSEEDLTDHDYYVLTLEPDDGDPEPAEHILDGVLELQ